MHKLPIYDIIKIRKAVELCFVSVDGRKAADPDNPMIFQKYWDVWLAFNMFFGAVYKVKPFQRILERINPHQPIKE